MDLKDTGCEDVKWMRKAHDRDQWQTLVNTAINFGLRKRGIFSFFYFWLDERL